MRERAICFALLLGQVMTDGYPLSDIDTAGGKVKTVCVAGPGKNPQQSRPS